VFTAIQVLSLSLDYPFHYCNIISCIAIMTSILMWSLHLVVALIITCELVQGKYCIQSMLL